MKKYSTGTEIYHCTNEVYNFIDWLASDLIDFDSVYWKLEASESLFEVATLQKALAYM